MSNRENQKLRISQAGVDLIKSFEGCPDGDPATVNLDPYMDPVKLWTVGWGHLIIDPITRRSLKGIEKQARVRELYPHGITVQEAEDLLRADLYRHERNVVSLVKFGLTQGEYDALVSFDFNTGKLATSTMLVRINAGDKAGAATEFQRWNKAGGRVLTGLIRRRKAERELFMGG